MPDWLERGPVREVLATLEGKGFEAYAVGGCVRNALLGVAVADFDVATSAHPKEVAAVFHDIFKVVPTGIDHGTVTVVADDRPVEVTTFRRDIETDGRRARVAFSDNMADDAARRDFTMNALYLDLRGAIHDPVGGLPDLNAHRVRFIGDANARIREDYLRSLRFFRFHAVYGDDEGGLDPEAMAAIAANLDGIEALSLERITSELLKTLGAPKPETSLGGMERCGLLAMLAPGAETRAVFELIELERQSGTGPEPIRRLVALGGRPRVRLSRAQAKRYDLLSHEMRSETGIAEIAWRHGHEVAESIALLRAAGLSRPLEPGLAEAISRAVGASFPLAASDLLPDLHGPALGDALDRAERAWLDSDFALDKNALLSIARSQG